MKILITGATGFIGSQLIHALSPEHQLVILSRQPQRAKSAFAHLSNLEYLADIDSLKNLDGFDAIINLAGEPIIGKRWNDQQKQRICHSRWDLTAKLSSLCHSSNQAPKIFISASAIGFYGTHQHERLTETSPAKANFGHKICAKWEQLALAAQNEHTRVCILRIGIVLGKNGGALKKMLLPFKLGLGGRIGHGHQGMSWIHQADLIALILLLLTDQTAQGIFNATAPHSVSNAEFARTLGKVIKRPTLLPTPAFVLKLALGESAMLLTKGQFVLPEHALSLGFKFKFPELRPALEDLLT